jgi:hypothetical protein
MKPAWIQKFVINISKSDQVMHKKDTYLGQVSLSQEWMINLTFESQSIYLGNKGEYHMYFSIHLEKPFEKQPILIHYKDQQTRIEK